MSNRRENPWGRGSSHAQRGSIRSSRSQEQNPKPGQKMNTSKSNTNIVSTSHDKFLKATQLMKEAADKHKQSGYESSSEEEELESENILGSVLKSYASLGGTNEDLGRTQNFLEDTFQSGAAICLICIATVKRNDAIWSCGNCWGFYHLLCVQRWAKDSIAHQKAALVDRPDGHSVTTISWACPKCRQSYEPNEIPQRYYCFCGHTEDPTFHPWLVPHSCGETCNRPLQPKCGHHCLLLCHPGPCPPCPKTVKAPCHCGKSSPRPQRCSTKVWSCGQPCARLLSCGKHSCSQTCHAGECAACPHRSTQPCNCGRKQETRECASPSWQCDKVCGKRLSCGHHACELVCHKGPCGECPRSLPRPCPCGKSTQNLPCMQDVPTCGDTCGRTLDCGYHQCSQRCHKDKCGVCLERTEKRCRCGLHTKEVPCQKDYLCETKCKQVKDCNRHPCNRKCCDGNCGPCEKPCGRTLVCGHHKCASVCHRGPCYPCPITVQVKCRCGSTAITVPCGRNKKTRPPRCIKPCKIRPDCHHPRRDPHRCHFGHCPPCRQVCGLPHENCPHVCPRTCHSAVLVNVMENFKPAGPWEKVAPRLELQALACGDCQESVSVSCVGNHEVTNVPCYRAKPYSCGRPCGRNLPCGNHHCSSSCHQVISAPNTQDAGVNCEPCASQRSLFIDPYNLKETMPVYFGTVMWDIGFPSIISAFSLVQLAFLHLTQLKLGPEKMRNKSCLSLIITAHFTSVVGFDVILAIYHSFHTVRILLETLFLLWGLFLCCTFLYAGYRVMSLLRSMSGILLQRDVGPTQYKGIMQLAMLAPYNNLATSVAAALVPTLLAPKLHGGASFLSAQEEPLQGQSRPPLSPRSLSKPSTSSMDESANLTSRSTYSRLDSSPSTSRQNSVLKMNKSESVESSADAAPEGPKLKKNLSWRAEESVAAEVLSRSKISFKRRKAKEEESENQITAETTLLPQDSVDTGVPDLTLHTILNHIAYVNRAAAHSDSGLAPTPANPTPASRKRQVTIVLRVTYATAILGLTLCIANIFQLYGPYGLSMSEDIRPWPWFCFQTFCRAVELAMGCAMANITKQPVTHRHQYLQHHYTHSIRIKQRESLFS